MATLPSVARHDNVTMFIAFVLELIGITENEEIEDDLIKGNVIFICSPNVNTALNMTFKFKEIRDAEDESKIKEWILKEIKLPCWFVSDYRASEVHHQFLWTKGDDGKWNRV